MLYQSIDRVICNWLYVCLSVSVCRPQAAAISCWAKFFYLLIFACWSATSFSFLMGQVSLSCNILLRTQLLYNLPLTTNDISLMVSSGTNCLNLFHPVRILVSTAASASLSLSLTNLGLYIFSSFFNAAATSLILVKSAGPSLTPADILWSHSFSSFISFSMYSFHDSLIPFSSLYPILLSDSLTPLYPVFLLPSAIRKISCW